MLTQDYNATLQSRTHWLVARANAQTKTSQRVCLSSRSKDKILIKHERTTRGIKHWGLGGYANNISRIKVGCSLIVKCSVIPNDFIPPTVKPKREFNEIRITFVL